jgi:hypothetical protein
MQVGYNFNKVLFSGRNCQFVMGTFGSEHCQLLLPERVLNMRVRTANLVGHVLFL